MKQNRKEILKTIFKLFLTRHYEDVSYDDMIKATNISKGGLYHYAPNKIELFRLVVDTFFLDLIKVEDDIMIKTSGSDKFALHDFLMSYASFLHKRFCRIQDFLQLPVDETARAFSFFILNSQRYHPSFRSDSYAWDKHILRRDNRVLPPHHTLLSPTYKDIHTVS